MSSSERETKIITLPDGLAGERIDAALARLLGLSRSSIVDLIEAGEIRNNKGPIAKSLRVVGGEWFEVVMPAQVAPAGLTATPITQEVTQATGISPLIIVHDDPDFVVVDKPVGVAAHPAPGWEGPTVIGALVAQGFSINTSGVAERQGIVHRLDAGTTGLMVVAKNETTYSNLKEQFRQRTVHKVYHAMVQGHVDPSEGTIDAPIDRHPKEDYKFAVVMSGKPSVTHYKALEYFPALSLVEVELETGRTHQIRVHFSALGRPLLGDRTYGADHTLAKKYHISRPWLHARQLTFTHPGTGEQATFFSEYPEDLKRVLEELRS
jgi:23S rRNA pseudouridine1911/1915/1917 synthase